MYTRENGYRNMTDEALVEALKKGDRIAEDYLYEKYKPFIRSRAHPYFLVGADREDIIQEGMIGLYKAIRDYNPERVASFKSFAEICVTRQIITAIKRATRQKHIPLNSYISLNKPLFVEDSERALIDVLSGGRASDPEEAFLGQEAYSAIKLHIHDALSKLERETLALYLEGRSYAEIAAALNRRPKAIDNALQRVKQKLEKVYKISAK